MKIPDFTGKTPRRRAALTLAALTGLTVAAALVSLAVQTDFGGVSVSRVRFENRHGIPISGKLLIPNSASPERPVPAVVFIPGYQSIAAAGDAIVIEAARRGVAALAIDAIGRGRSGSPGRDATASDFDETYGGRAAFDYLSGLDVVDGRRVAMTGHSLGGQMAYKVAMENEAVVALVMLGTAYDRAATPTRPKNLLMIFGVRDAFRDRMTGTRHVETDWLQTEVGRAPFPVPHPRPATTYGRFADGTARRVRFPSNGHMTVAHDTGNVAASLRWLFKAFDAAPSRPVDSGQIWPLKEGATLIAYGAGILAVLPLGFLLLGTRLFAPLRVTGPIRHVASRRTVAKESLINAGLMWLYLPSSMVVFAIHKYLVPIDGVLPLMVVNVVLFWFLLTNGVGFIRFRRWVKGRKRADPGFDAALGLSFDAKGRTVLLRSGLLALLLFGYALGLEWVLETFCHTTYRFIFSFASRLTLHRFGMWLRYAPLFVVGFIPLGQFLHLRLRLEDRRTWLASALRDSAVGAGVLIAPMVLLAAVQYVPLWINGAIPLVGPGGMFVLFVINIWHLVAVLAVMVPVSAFAHRFTGRPYLGALLCGLILAWMFASCQVIAPVPV